MPFCSIYSLIDAREGKCIFQACIIYIRVVDTKVPFAIFLGDNNDVGQPFRILNFSNDAGLKGLVNFLFYDFSTHWMEKS